MLFLIIYVLVRTPLDLWMANNVFGNYYKKIKIISKKNHTKIYNIK